MYTFGKINFWAYGTPRGGGGSHYELGVFPMSKTWGLFFGHYRHNYESLCQILACN